MPPTPSNALDTEPLSVSDHTPPLDHQRKHSMADLAAIDAARQGVVETTQLLNNNERAGSTQQSQPHLLGIPNELLNRIVELAVVSPERIDVYLLPCEDCGNNDFGECPHEVNSKPPALASVSKTLARTVLPIYYGQNVLHFNSIRAAVDMFAYVQTLPYKVTIYRVFLAVKSACSFAIILDDGSKVAFDGKIEVRVEEGSNQMEVSSNNDAVHGICEECWGDIKNALERVKSTFASAEMKPALNNMMNRLFRELLAVCKRETNGRPIEYHPFGSVGGLGNCFCINE